MIHGFKGISVAKTLQVLTTHTGNVKMAIILSFTVAIMAQTVEIQCSFHKPVKPVSTF